MGQVGGGAEKKGEMGRTTKKIGTQEKVGMEEGGTGRRWGQEGDISRTTKKVEAEEEVGMEGGQIGCGTGLKGVSLSTGRRGPRNLEK